VAVAVAVSTAIAMYKNSLSNWHQTTLRDNITVAYDKADQLTRCRRVVKFQKPEDGKATKEPAGF
jgi:hypothetical protein